LPESDCCSCLWKDGRADAVRTLIASGADVSNLSSAGHSVLKVYCLNGFDQVVRVLLESQGVIVQLNRLGADGHTPLYVATTEGHVSVMLYLIDAGADVDLASMDGRTPLMLACMRGDVAAAACLIDAGATIDAARENGATALMEASTKGHVAVIRLLISRGCDIQKLMAGNISALMLAVIGHYTNVVTLLLLNGADLNTVNSDGDNVMMIAAGAGYEKLISVLYQSAIDTNQVINLLQTDNMGNTAFMVACGIGSLEIVNKLLAIVPETARSEMVMLANRFGLAPIQMAAVQGHVELVLYLMGIMLKLDLDIQPVVSFLVDLAKHFDLKCIDKYDPKSFSVQGNTLLHWVVARGSIVAITNLLKGDSTRTAVNEKNNLGCTPLFWAAFISGELSLVTQLLDAGADPNAVDQRGESCLHYFGRYGENTAILELLMHAGADIEARNNQGQTALALAEAYNKHIIINNLREWADFKPKPKQISAQRFFRAPQATEKNSGSRPGPSFQNTSGE